MFDDELPDVGSFAQAGWSCAFGRVPTPWQDATLCARQSPIASEPSTKRDRFTVYSDALVEGAP
jgi:hypothetical protein